MPAAQPVSAAPRLTASWYGGGVHGLELLTLPRWRTPADPAVAQNAAWVARINEPAFSKPPPTDVDDAEARLFWFRWITGHQVSFILWQLTGRAWARFADAGGDDLLDAMTDCVRGYSAMLLYCGSCPASIYERVIRPTMRQQHPAFSGAWAPDYAAVRPILRGRNRPAVNSPAMRLLHAQIEINHRVHLMIAKKLVPDGPSLLQASASTMKRCRADELGAVYDEYFLTRRAHVEDRIVLDQLRRRLKAISADVERFGRYPEGLETLREIGLPPPDIHRCAEISAFLTRLTDVVWVVSDAEHRAEIGGARDARPHNVHGGGRQR